MRNNNLLVLAAVAVIALVVLLNSAFIVRQDRQAIVLRFNAITAAINEAGANEPGLYFKAPFIDRVVVYDKRNMGLTIEGQAVVPSDQWAWIAAYPPWRFGLL